MHRTKVGTQWGFDYILVATCFSIIGCCFKKYLCIIYVPRTLLGIFKNREKKLLPPGTYNRINKRDLGGTKRVIKPLKELKTKKEDCTLR